MSEAMMMLVGGKVWNEILSCALDGNLMVTEAEAGWMRKCGGQIKHLKWRAGARPMIAARGKGQVV